MNNNVHQSYGNKGDSVSKVVKNNTSAVDEEIHQHLFSVKCCPQVCFWPTVTHSLLQYHKQGVNHAIRQKCSNHIANCLNTHDILCPTVSSLHLSLCSVIR